MDSFFRELRHALRRLSRQPGSTAIAVLTLAIGIGLTGSMYSILDAVLLRGLPFDHSERLLHLERNNLARGAESLEVSHHDFEDWRAQQQSFEGLAGFATGTFNLADEGLPDRYNGAWISTNFLDLLRVEPALGRGFAAGDGEPGAEPVILLGHQVWQSRYGSAPEVVGKTVRVNGERATVIGVLPPGFRFPFSHDVWMPLPSVSREHPRGEGQTLEVFGRLKEGVSLDRAASEMATLAGRLAQQYPASNTGIGVVVKPYADEFVDEDTRLMLGVMLGAVSLVLLIACFNVTNLLLARASERTRDLALHTALGAQRSRVFAGVMSEAVLIAAAGAVLGVVAAHFAVRAVGRAVQTTEPPFWMDFYLSLPALGLVLLTTLLSAFVAGLLPALRASKSDVNVILQDAARGSSFRLSWLSRVLVVLEVAISCVLLVGAGLMVRTVLEANRYDLHFQTDNLLAARLGLFEGDHPQPADWLRFYERLEEQVAARSEVVSVAVGTVIPVDTTVPSSFTRFERPGEVYEDPQKMPFARLVSISVGYFETLGVELVAGRDFTLADREGAARVAIVNQDFARKEWPGQNAVGQRLDLWRGAEEEAASSEAGWVEVVGVVPTLRYADFNNADDQQGIYVPMAQEPRRFVWVVARTRQEPLAFASALRRAAAEVDPNLPLYFIRSMDQVIAKTMFFKNLLGVVFALFGGVALLLASIGLYGVMAFGVARRTREMGVRMAFGARAADVLRLVLGQGLRQVAWGLGIGIVASLAMVKLVRGFLFQVEPRDPLTFVVVVVVLTAVALLACVIPARRAASVDPIKALRWG